MRLTDDLITSIEFEGVEIPLDVDFCIVLTVFEVLEDKDLTDWQKLETVLYLMIGENELTGQQGTDLFKKITNEVIANGVETGPTLDITGEPIPDDVLGGENGPSYDFVTDAELIYSSFMQAYGIDLFEVKGNFHWQKFTALLKGLPPDSALQQVINIRQKELPTGPGTEEQRAELIKLKRIYELPKRE